jgi:RND superfamily putative drug exporter
VFAVLLLRPPRPKPIPVRVAPGEGVCTQDGHAGTVVRVDHGLALVQIDAEAAVWCDVAQLMDAEGDVPADAHAAALARIAAEAQIAAAAPDSSGIDAHPEADAARRRDSIPGLRSFAAPRLTADTSGLLGRLAGATYDARRTIAIGWLVVVLACVPLAATAQKSLTAGGFTPAASQTQAVINDMSQHFELPIAREQVIVPGTRRQTRALLTKNAERIFAVPHVLAVTDLQESRDHKLSVFTVQLDVKDEDAVDIHDSLVSALAASGFDTRHTQIGGTAAYYYDIGDQTAKDLAKAEQIGIPAALIILVLVFGTAVAAVVPLAIGLASVVITLALIHLLSYPLHLSIYVMNIASMLGLGLGIDYSLLGVSRFREELAAGAAVRDAIITTVTSAGRAAAISGVAVLVGMSALAMIPLKVMSSMAIGGVVVVATCGFATLTLLPALLALLGPRIEKLPVRRVRPTREAAGFWYRGTHAVMKRPVLAIAFALVLLVMMANPIRSVVLGVPHDDVLPATAPARIAQQTLADRFGIQVSAPCIVELWSADPRVVASVRAQMAKVANVQKVVVIARRPALGRSLLAAFPIKGRLGGPLSRAMAAHIRAQVHAPVRMELSGQGPGETEFLAAIKSGVPKTLALVLVSTLLILLVAFRSVALPLKAIVLDTLSIIASLGLVVAVFQMGHGAQLLGSHPMGYTESTIPVIQFCVLFGLSMDYEVFMLARISELYQQGHGNREATARGVAGTAPLVTGAALILIALGMSFATSKIVLVKQIGFGMGVALALDATLVRFLLLPATMRLLGDINWWLPRPLMRRLPRISWAH